MQRYLLQRATTTSLRSRPRPPPHLHSQFAGPEIPSSIASSSDKSSELCRDKSEQPMRGFQINSKIIKSNSNSGAKRRAMASRRSATIHTKA